MKESDESLRSDSEYQSVVAIIILCISKDFHFGVLNLFEGNFHQGIKLIYFSLTDIYIRTVTILFLIHLHFIKTPRSSSDELLWYLPWIYSFNFTTLLH